MKLTRYFFLIGILIILCLSGCEDLGTEEADAQNRDEVISVMQEMDQQFLLALPLSTMNIMNSMPQPDTLFIDSSWGFDENFDFIPDSAFIFDEFDFIGPFFVFSNIHGTFSFVDGMWSYNPEPQGSTIISFDYNDQIDGTVKPVEIIFTNAGQTATNLTSTFELWIDSQKTLWIDAVIEGTNFNTPNVIPTLTHISFIGTSLNSEGHQFDFDIDITKTNNILTITVDNNPPMIFTLTADDFLQGPDSEPDVSKITIEYKNLLLEINDPEAESGDVGDVMLDGEKVADLVIINDEVYMEFPDGEQVDLKTIMQNLFNFMMIQEGI